MINKDDSCQRERGEEREGAEIREGKRGGGVGAESREGKRGREREWGS